MGSKQITVSSVIPQESLTSFQRMPAYDSIEEKLQQTDNFLLM